MKTWHTKIRPKFYTVSWVYVLLELAFEMDSGKLQLLHFVLSESSEFYTLTHSLKSLFSALISVNFVNFTEDMIFGFEGLITINSPNF